MTIFGWDTTIWISGIWGCKKKNLINIEKIAFKFLQMKFWYIWYIYSRKFTKYLHGTWSLLNILMIFGIKEKSIILTHTYCWLLLQIYQCYLWLVLWSRVTYYIISYKNICFFAVHTIPECIELNSILLSCKNLCLKNTWKYVIFVYFLICNVLCLCVVNFSFLCVIYRI